MTISLMWKWVMCSPWTHAKSLILAAQIQIPIPNEYLRCGYKGLVICRNNGWKIENIDKGLTLSKWVLIVLPKIPQIPQKLSVQFVSSTKVWDFNDWASVVHKLCHFNCIGFWGNIPGGLHSWDWRIFL